MKTSLSSCQTSHIDLCFILLSLLLLFLPTFQVDPFRCKTDGFFPDKRDCWLYHICVGTTHSVKACKDDLMFNPIKNECDWAMNVNCSNSTSSSPEDTLPALVPTRIPVPPDYYISPKQNVSHGSIFDYLCQSIDNDYIAHPTDCKQYAYCANGIPQPKACKKSLFWSQTEKMCVWPVQSDCPVKNIVPIPPSQSPGIRNPAWIPRESTYPPSYLLTEAASSRIASDVEKSSFACPPTHSWRVPDPFDCSVYHDCYHGTDLLSHCPAQLQYNPEKQACDYAQNVQCKNKCTDKNEGARFIDPTSCCHYHECILDKLVLQSCTYPELFDMQVRKCLPYKKVKCDGRRPCFNKCHYLAKYDGGKGLCNFIPSCTGYSDGYYLDRTKPNCQSYIHCVDNRVVNHSRCANGLRFNRNMGRCTAADQVPCLASSSTSWSLLMFILLLATNVIL